jgi:hypothetical protein
MFASNVISLAAWSALLIGGSLLSYAIPACLLLALCFASLPTVDRNLYAKAVLSPWFFRLRCNATLIVISMLLLVAIAPR